MLSAPSLGSLVLMIRSRTLILFALAFCLFAGKSSLVAQEGIAPPPSTGLNADQGGGINPIVGGRRTYRSSGNKSKSNDPVSTVP